MAGVLARLANMEAQLEEFRQTIRLTEQHVAERWLYELGVGKGGKGKDKDKGNNGPVGAPQM